MNIEVSKWNNINSILFSTYPREIGKKRLLVRNEDEFLNRIEQIDGLDEVFTNVNPLDGTIDKMFFDFDGESALVEAKKVYTNLSGKNVPVIPVASGKKGIHIYILCKTRRGSDNKEILLKASLSVLKESIGEKNLSADPHVLGDVRRLCRVPNTLRPPENNSYCTYLPFGKEFLEMTEGDLIKSIKGVHFYDYDLPSPWSFEDFILPEIKGMEFNLNNGVDNGSNKSVGNNEQLKHLLRPCLYRQLTISNPKHAVRVASTVDLLNIGCSPNEIADMYSKLAWEDWNRGITIYQVQSCRHLKAYFCKTLKRLGIPDSCKNCER